MTIKTAGKTDAPKDDATKTPAELDAKEGNGLVLTLAKLSTYVMADGRVFREGCKYELDKAESKELLKHKAPNGEGVFKLVEAEELEEGIEIVKLRKAKVEVSTEEETHSATDADITVIHSEAKNVESLESGIEGPLDNDLNDITVV